jgi:hypothetical protein
MTSFNSFQPTVPAFEGFAKPAAHIVRDKNGIQAVLFKKRE